MSFLYQTGMSIADFGATTALTGGVGGGIGAGAGKAANLIIQGGRSATMTFQDAKKRGATDEQALAAGTAAGIAEAVFEKVSLDSFIKMGGSGKAALLKNILKQSGVEASEEAATEMANAISDMIIMGGLSNYNIAVEGYMAQGMSREEAQGRAAGDTAANIGQAALGGAISGGVVGSVGGFCGNASGKAAAPASTVINTQPLGTKADMGVATGEGGIIYSEGYTQDDITRIKKEGRTFRNVIVGIDTTVSEFFNKWKDGRKSSDGEKLEKLYLGKTTDVANEDISNILGYDVDGRDFIITNDGVKHIFNRHGANGTATRQGSPEVTPEFLICYRKLWHSLMWSGRGILARTEDKELNLKKSFLMARPYISSLTTEVAECWRAKRCI
jgi:hypothetical protein